MAAEWEVQNWLRTRLFNQVPVSICVIDRAFRIVEANRRFRQTYGPWQGRLCYQVYKGRKSRCDQCGALMTFEDGKVRVREEEGMVRGGLQVQYLVHLIPVLQPNGEASHIIEMSTDISAIKRLEEEKREAERLAAVGETVAGIAHGIKNILMGLEGGVYAVNSGMETGNDERIARGWITVEENIERISKFVKEFLDYARGRIAKVQMTDPNRPAREVVDLYREKAAQAGIELRADLQEDIPRAPLDGEAIHTSLANLVSNAVDACSICDEERKYVITLSTRDNGGMLVYEVADNGRGMDYEISKKVFSKFFTTKGSDKGTGLGLLTTKKAIQQHGGRVSFQSTEGEGSVFRIELPRGNLPRPEEEA